MLPSSHVEQILRAKRLESFTVEGASPNVVLADSMAWAGLESVLGTDPVERWAIKVMQHDYVPAENGPDGKPCVKFHCEFIRMPDEDAE